MYIADEKFKAYTPVSNSELRCNARCGWLFADQWGQKSKVHKKHINEPIHQQHWSLFDEPFRAFASLGKEAIFTDGQLLTLKEDMSQHTFKGWVIKFVYLLQFILFLFSMIS